MTAHLKVHAYVHQLGPEHEVLYACVDGDKPYIYTKKHEGYFMHRLSVGGRKLIDKCRFLKDLEDDYTDNDVKFIIEPKLTHDQVKEELHHERYNS